MAHHHSKSRKKRDPQHISITHEGEKEWGVGKLCKPPKLPPQCHSFSMNALPFQSSIHSQRAPATGEHIIKCMSLWWRQIPHTTTDVIPKRQLKSFKQANLFHHNLGAQLCKIKTPSSLGSVNNSLCNWRKISSPSIFTGTEINKWSCVFLYKGIYPKNISKFALKTFYCVLSEGMGSE